MKNYQKRVSCVEPLVVVQTVVAFLRSLRQVRLLDPVDAGRGGRHHRVRRWHVHLMEKQKLY